MFKRTLMPVTLIAVASFAPNAAFAACAEWMNHEVRKLHSRDTVDICEVLGDKPALIINTASHCGYTPQFSGLEQLHQEYAEKGLVVMGVPSNDFRQEAKEEAKTADICYKNYGVSFTMTAPQTVRGKDAHPFFAHLGEEKGAPRWNFNKYLIDAEGNVVARFGSGTKPESAELRDAISAVLP